MKTAGDGSEPNPRTKRYLEGLLEGDDDVAYAAVKTMLAEEASVADVYLKLLTPAMVRVGELWRKRKINVGQQKLATEITLRQMERLRSIIGTKPKSFHRALVCCIQGEQHSTGAEMAADLFRLEGWSVDFLGADVPTDDLLTMVKKRQPQILGLSVTMKQNLRHLRRLLEALSKLAVRPKILIGGQATGTLARWKVGNLDFNVVANLMDGLNFAQTALRSMKPKVDLEQYLREIGLRIRQLRTRAGQTQAQLAEAANLNRAYIVSVEHGKQNISMGVVIRIANALGVTAEQLLLT
jgi:methanogenic corrinoid protein MtbC1/DNA-binding XRE family transcriptional regulator